MVENKAISMHDEKVPWNDVLNKMFAEFVGMTLFVFVGPASAINGGAASASNGSILQVALTFGFAIFVLACAIGHHSGGQMNCAVTLCLVLTGDVTVLQGVLNFFAQLLGSFCASLLLWSVYPVDKDATKSLGSNDLASGYDWHNALVGEMLMTFFLCFVVLETAVNKSSSKNTVQLAIGMAVFLAHSCLIKVDGCSINPTRSFGPAVVASLRWEADDRADQRANQLRPENIWDDHWVFWVGPLVGAAIAALASRLWWHPGDIPEPEPVAPAPAPAAPKPRVQQ